MTTLPNKNNSDADSSTTSESIKPAIEGITVDCVIFGFNKANLEVLLVQHAEGESVGKWGLL